MFIEVTRLNGKKNLLNKSLISIVEWDESRHTTSLWFTDEVYSFIEVQETFEQVKQLLKG